MKIFLILLLLPNILFANLLEKDLGLEDSKYLREEINKFFYDGNNISSPKLNKLREKIKNYRDEEIKNMTENLQAEGLALEDAQGKAKKDKKIKIFNFLLFKLENPHPSEFKDILRLYYGLIDKSVDAPVITGLKIVTSLMFKGHGVPLKELKRKRPSNLVNTTQNRYYTKSELTELIKNGEDLSLMDPPDSTFWKKPKNISSIDPRLELEIKNQIPKTFYFKKTYKLNTNPKLGIFEKLPNGKKKAWKIKFGREMNTEIVASRMMNLLGYFSDEYYHVKNAKVYFKNKAEYEQMVVDWIGNFNDGTDFLPENYIKETGEDENGFYCILLEGLLEARPKNEVRVGMFHVNEMANWERREVRAQLLYQAFIGNIDFKPSSNNKVKIIKKGKDKSKWEVRELVHDLGWAFGDQFSPNTPNKFRWSFIKKGLLKLKINYRNNHFIEKKKNPFQQVSYSDMKWLARYLVQMTREQLDQIIKVSGWPNAVAVLMREKITSRRNEIVKAFDLEGEVIEGQKINIWPEVNPKTFNHGEFIKKGKLIKGYKPVGSAIDFNSSEFIPIQLLDVARDLIGPIFAATKEIPFYRMASFPQEVSGFGFEKIVPGLGIGFRLGRVVEINRGAKDQNKAWITHDTLEIFGNVGALGIIPITTGVEGHIEIQALIGKQFKVSYFSSTPLKAIIGRPKLLAELPFKKRKIIKNLKPGESYGDGLFVGIEVEEGIETTGLVGVGAELEQRKIFLNITKIDKGENGLIDVSKGTSTKFEFTFAAYIKLFKFLQLDFFKAGIKYGHKKIKTYHFDINNPSFDERKAYQLAAFSDRKNKFLEGIPFTSTDIKFYEKFWELGVLATIGGNTQGFYTVKELPDGSKKRFFDYKTIFTKKNPFKYRESQYKVLAHMEFSDEDFTQVTKQNVALEYEVIDHQTEYKEMKSSINIINKLVNNKNFLTYNPENYAKPHLGKTFTNLRFDLNDNALNCIFEKKFCPAKGPLAYVIGRKLKSIRKAKTPIKKLKKLGPWLRNNLLRPVKFKPILEFIGGENFSTELWIQGDFLNRDQFIHRKLSAIKI